jgi:hypothetical protein
MVRYFKRTDRNGGRHEADGSRHSLVKLTNINGILVSLLKISHKGKSITLESVIIDTGSAHTWINLDAVENVLDVNPEEGDHIITAYGIGG